MTGTPRLAWLACAIALFACGCTRPIDPVVAIAKAQDARSKRAYPVAIIELKNLLQQEPDHAEGHYLLGMVYLQSGAAHLAGEEFTAALARGYDPKLVLPELAKSLIAQEKFKEALEVTDPGRAAGAQGSPEVLNVRALALVALRRLPAAKQSVEQAMAIKPDFADGMLMLARIALLEKEDVEKALALVEQAIGMEPRNTDAWLLKGDLQRQAGSMDLARVAYAHAAGLAPVEVTPQISLASLEIDAANYNEAARAVAAATKIAPEHVMVKYLTGLLALQKGDHAAALRAASSALDSAAEHVPSALLAARSEIALQHPTEAERYLNIAIRIAPRNIPARTLLAALQMKNGQAGAAVSTLEPVLDLPDATADPALMALSGEAYLAIGNITKATQAFEKAASLDPKNAPARVGLGMTRMVMGQTEQAIADLEAATSLGGGTLRTDIMLVMVSLRRKQYDEALRLLDKLEKAYPGTMLMVHNLRAAAYVGKSNIPRARAELEAALRLDPGYFSAAANLAKLDLESGNSTAARERYERVLKKDPNQSQAMLALARIAPLTPGGDKEALEWIERAARAAPASSAPTRAKIDYYRRIGAPDKALTVAVEQRKRTPDDPDLMRIIGQLLIVLGNTADAVTVFSERVVLLPRSSEAYLDLADAQLVAKNPAAAAATLRTALKVSPRDLRLQAALATAELKQERSDRASEIIVKIKAQTPRDPLGYMLEGDVHAANKRYSQALAAYEQAYQLDKTALVVLKLYEASAQAGKIEEGETRVKQWLAEKPKDNVTRRTFAYQSIARGRYALGVEQYRKVLEYQPREAVALNNLAYALHKLKDPTALQYAQEAHEIAPANGMFADTLAQIQIDKGDLPGGLATLEKAVASSPSNLEIRLTYARALASAGDKDRAIKQLEMVVRAGSQFSRSKEAAALMKELKS